MQLHLSRQELVSTGLPSQDAIKNGGHRVDDTFTVRTLPGEENCSCSKHIDSGEFENCFQEQWTL